MSNQMKRTVIKEPDSERLLHLGRRRRAPSTPVTGIVGKPYPIGDDEWACTYVLEGALEPGPEIVGRRFDPGAQPRALRPLSRSDRPARTTAAGCCNPKTREPFDLVTLKATFSRSTSQFQAVGSALHVRAPMSSEQPLARNPGRRLRGAHGRCRASISWRRCGRSSRTSTRAASGPRAWRCSGCGTGNGLDVVDPARHAAPRRRRSESRLPVAGAGAASAARARSRSGSARASNAASWMTARLRSDPRGAAVRIRRSDAAAAADRRLAGARRRAVGRHSSCRAATRRSPRPDSASLRTLAGLMRLVAPDRPARSRGAAPV